MKYYFLPADFELLKQNIQETAGRVKTAQSDMGKSTTESSETWHDNFGFEDGRRRVTMWSKRYSDLQQVARFAVIVEPRSAYDKVAFGCSVTFIESDTGEERTIRIGSYYNLSETPGVISYAAPLAKSLMGAEVGEERTFEIGGKKKVLTVITIGA